MADFIEVKDPGGYPLALSSRTPVRDLEQTEPLSVIKSAGNAHYFFWTNSFAASAAREKSKIDAAGTSAFKLAVELSIAM